MYGLCVLNKTFKLLLLIFIFPLFCWAQAQRATIVNDGALVYEEPDFDAPVIDTLKRGTFYSISKTTKGPFYKIRLKSGGVGWIADTDLKKGEVKLGKTKGEKLVEKKGVEKKAKPFFASRYRGPTMEYVNYTEDTLGKERSSGLLFFGVKFNGYNTVFDGDIYTEANIVLFSGAPSYYADYTGKSTDGFIFMTNFIFQTVLPQSKSHMLFYGFGPMLKYSSFDLAVPNETKTLNYKASDMTVGAVFNVGLGFRLGPVSLRVDGKYYWEQTKYYGAGLNLGYEF